MLYKQLKANLCLYIALVDNLLLVVVAWIDDIVGLVPLLLVEQIQQDLEKAFTCKHKELIECMGSKIAINHDSTGLSNTVGTGVQTCRGVQATDGPAMETPAVAEQVLMKGNWDGAVQESRYIVPSATAIFIHMMQWPCLDILNAFCRLARYMPGPGEAHSHPFMTLIRYVVSNKNKNVD